MSEEETWQESLSFCIQELRNSTSESIWKGYKRIGSLSTGEEPLTQEKSPFKGDSEGLEIEFVGARKESYQRDSRKPIVEDGTLEDDQNRRDFTINAMAICLNKSRFGELVDPFGGVDDLYDGIIRTPLDPDITFSDDPLRMLRCIRFATRFNFLIEDETFEALERNAERIKIISGERIAPSLAPLVGCSPRYRQTEEQALGSCSGLDIPCPQHYRSKDGSWYLPQNETAYGCQDEIRTEDGGTSHASYRYCR